MKLCRYNLSNDMLHDMPWFSYISSIPEMHEGWTHWQEFAQNIRAILADGPQYAMNLHGWLFSSAVLIR